MTEPSSEEEVNQFEIIRKLGEGSYSSVYKVVRKVDGQEYAMKKIRLGNLTSKEKENAINEVRFLASINSPYVVQYKQAIFDEKNNYLFIIMEYMPGGDMLQKIKSLKKKGDFIDEALIWRYIVQILNGLKSLHQLQILHRDLKNANIFLSRDQRSIKLGDFNVSKVAKQGILYTQTGTPYYASPEVWKDKPYDNKSDIWSMGCLVYEIIVQRPPFHANDMDTLFKRIQKGVFDSLPSKYSKDLQNFISLCLQTNSKLRPSCEEFLKMDMIKDKSYTDLFTEAGLKNQLLQTIRIPKGFKGLKSRLPQSRYYSYNQSKMEENYQFQQNQNNFVHQSYNINLSLEKNIQNQGESSKERNEEQSQESNKTIRSFKNLNRQLKKMDGDNALRENSNQKNQKNQIIQSLKREQPQSHRNKTDSLHEQQRQNSIEQIIKKQQNFLKNVAKVNENILPPILRNQNQGNENQDNSSRNRIKTEINEIKARMSKNNFSIQNLKENIPLNIQTPQSKISSIISPQFNSVKNLAKENPIGFKKQNLNNQQSTPNIFQNQRDKREMFVNAGRKLF